MLYVSQIYGGVDLTSYEMVRLCHTQTQPQVYLSTGNSIVMQFISDISNSGRGFNATYQTVDEGLESGNLFMGVVSYRGGGRLSPNKYYNATIFLPIKTEDREPGL